MRIRLAIASVALIASQGTANAVPLRACAQVSTRVDAVVRPLLANLAEPQLGGQLRAQLRACLSSRNLCSVVHDAQDGKQALVAAETTADLPAQQLSWQGKSPVIFLVRSIPRVRNDSNQYCLISEKFSAATSVPRWDVYGWVVSPNASEILPLQRQTLDSDPKSLRGLAAALWFFAARMSGQASSVDSEESPR